MKVYTPDELTENCGSEGKKTLVAVGSAIYDFSGSKKWVNGAHMKRHRAGTDLTSDLQAAPHGPEVLEKFEKVGIWEGGPKESFEGFRGTIEPFLDRFPWFRRHPHPSAVHVPIGLVVVAPILQVIAMITGSERTEWAVFCCLIIALITLPSVILTGYFAWWINYGCHESRIILIKRRLAWIALIFGGAAVYLRAAVVEPLVIDNTAGIIYLITIAALTLLISYVGYLGGKLTFPYE